MTHLTVSDLVVEYRTGDYAVRPIDGLSLDVPPGSLVLLLGPSGCGKTTLLSCLGGILTPTSGTIRYGDIDVAGLSGAALTRYRRRTVGIVFQAFNLVDSLTATENVALPMRSAGGARKPSVARAEALLDQVGLAERAHHRPGDMSGGQQQRVAIARALAMDPPLLLADEPTAHLDFIQVEEILRLIRSLASGERSVIVSTHDSRMVPLADQVIELVPDFAREERAPVTVSLKAGEDLFRQGDQGDLVYIVESGEITILREHADGTEQPLVHHGAGGHFGEMGPLLGMPRSATARARTDCVLTGMTVRAFRERSGAPVHH